MPGLLDWLTDSLGNSAGAGSLGNPNSYAPPIPPVSSPYDKPEPQPGSDRPPMIDPARAAEFMRNSAGPGSLGNPQIPGPGMPPVQQTGDNAAPLPPPGAIPGPPPQAGPQPGPLPPMPPGARPPMGQDPMGVPTGFPPPPPPPEAFARGGDAMAGTGSGAGPDRITPPVQPGGGVGSDAARAPNQPPIPPVPMPQGRPAEAGPGANAPTDASSINVTPKNVQVGQQIEQKGQEINWLGRMMGAKSPEEGKKIAAQIIRGMGAGLKNIGKNTGAGKFASFASGVGAGISGVAAEQDRQEESQRKYIAQKILANNSSGTQELNLARTQLALEQAKAVMTGQGSKLDSPQQLYLRANALANNDADVKKARMDADALVQKQGYKPTDPEAKAAEEKFLKLYNERKAHHLGALGLDPKLGEALGKLPGLSKDTALQGDKLTQQAYDALPIGGYYMDPKTKTLKQKAPAPGTVAPPPVAARGAAAPPPTVPTAPPTPPITAPAGSRAALEDEDADTDVG